MQSRFKCPSFRVIEKNDWIDEGKHSTFFNELKRDIGEDIVVRPANQGSSIGVSILRKPALKDFKIAVDKGFFTETVEYGTWQLFTKKEKENYIKELIDIKQGIGLPLLIGEITIHQPEKLLQLLDQQLTVENESVRLEAIDSESSVIVEAFIDGKEFSCIVVKKENGQPVALPPTEIVKDGELFDYRSKYLAGLSRKVTPIDLPEEQIEAIRTECELLFEFFQFDVYARIDGFINAHEEIFLNDPNTTSGMLPSSFFFHQAAEIGLNPSQFISYIIWCSLKDRLNENVDFGNCANLLYYLQDRLKYKTAQPQQKKKIAVILGGVSSERHISVESGRNIYEKLASSKKYQPVPIFLTGSLENHELFVLPVNILLKDNADDIKFKLSNYKKHPVIEKIKDECAGLHRATDLPGRWSLQQRTSNVMACLSHCMADRVRMDVFNKNSKNWGCLTMGQNLFHPKSPLTNSGPINC